jgi:C_GCAxxG_C_C family probable redox protein
MSSQEYFAQVAGDWDRLRAGFFPEAVRTRALELAGVRAGSAAALTAGAMTAADLGAGTGFLTEALLAAGLSVAAVDQSPQMLAELRAKFAVSGRVTLLEGKAEALPLPDASVDLVFANMFLHHVDDPALAIAEMARVVRPGGRIVVTDLDSHDHRFLLTEHHDRWPGFARADVEGWLRAAGLAEATVDCLGENCCADSCDTSDQARISIFAAHARRPLARPASLAEPLAVGARARSFFADAAPLLCAESVLLAVSEALGVASPLIPRLATGFCSGLSRTSGPCGALSGGVMALGLALGRDSGRESLDPAYAAVQEYLEYFRATFPADNCLGLTGCDLGTPEGQRGFRDTGAKQKVCLPVVEAAAAHVMRILADHQAALEQQAVGAETPGGR